MGTGVDHYNMLFQDLSWQATAGCERLRDVFNILWNIAIFIDHFRSLFGLRSLLNWDIPDDFHKERTSKRSNGRTSEPTRMIELRKTVMRYVRLNEKTHE